MMEVSAAVAQGHRPGPKRASPVQTVADSTLGTAHNSSDSASVLRPSRAPTVGEKLEMKKSKKARPLNQSSSKEAAAEARMSLTHEAVTEEIFNFVAETVAAGPPNRGCGTPPGHPPLKRPTAPGTDGDAALAMALAQEEQLLAPGEERRSGRGVRMPEAFDPAQEAARPQSEARGTAAPPPQQ